MKIADVRTGGDDEAAGKTRQAKEKVSPLLGAADKDDDAGDDKRESDEMGQASVQDGLRRWVREDDVCDPVGIG